LLVALLAAIIMGLTGGVLGAIFVGVNKRTYYLRKRFITKNW